MTTWSCIPEERDWLGRTPAMAYMDGLERRLRERARREAAYADTPIYAALTEARPYFPPFRHAWPV